MGGAGLLLVILAAVLPGRGIEPGATVLAGARWTLPDGVALTRCEVRARDRWSPFGCEVSPSAMAGSSTARPAIRLWHAGVNRLSRSADDPAPLQVRVLPAWWAYTGALGILLLLLALPGLLFTTTGVDEAGGRVSAWYALLSEPGGGPG